MERCPFTRKRCIRHRCMAWTGKIIKKVDEYSSYVYEIPIEGCIFIVAMEELIELSNILRTKKMKFVVEEVK